MAQEPGSLQQSLRNILTSSSQISTVKQFYELRDSEMDIRILRLSTKLLDSDVGKQHEGAVSTIRLLYKQSRYERYRPLINLILANDVKSDEEIFQFIEQQFNAPQSSLPASMATSGLTNSSTKHSSFMPALNRELDGSMYTNVPGLVEYFITKQHIDPTLRLQPHESFIKKKCQEKLEDKPQDIMLRWVASIFEQLGEESHSRGWQSHPTTRMEGIRDAIRRLDGAIMSRHVEAGNHIQNIMVPFELKKNTSDAREAAIDLAKYVYQVFNHQPTRSYVIGLTLCGTSMQLWQFDRCGAIGSESFDVQANKENFEKFFSLLSSLLTCNHQDLGFDPTFMDVDGQACSNTSEWQKIRYTTQDGPQELVIDSRPIFRASGICGRGTTTWKAHLHGDERQKYLIKDSWQPEKHEQEGDMLCKVAGLNIPHLVRYHHHEDVQVAGNRVDIKSHVRRQFKFDKCKTFTLGSGPKQPQNVFNNRFLRRIILKDVGQPIWTVKTPVRLLEALEGCIIGHQDVAIAHGELNDDKHHTMIGTKVFMSASLLLNKNHHSHVDDLESFFWVFVWFCIHFPDENSERIGVLNWNQQSRFDLGCIKAQHLHDPHPLMMHFAPRYKESPLLLECVANFAKIVSDASVRDNRPAAALYLEVLNVLREAQGKPKLNQS
ncbi:hypothetical protein PGTUg99_018436 [Puccinia graminis f. sp. tritici]|uniref:Fungal-type protein kinase domain-containing protein n=1 Tax=Puccinia graminis f. sp. tritici TaxID=56615 RepID=A0A5B0PGW9_PUCGR|nr:hypothetical protein PGTUg99_018436 [Puccinia graminis f. sp. tritici]